MNGIKRVCTTLHLIGVEKITDSAQLRDIISLIVFDTQNEPEKGGGLNEITTKLYIIYYTKLMFSLFSGSCSGD